MTPTYILHLPRRADRLEHVKELRLALPGAVIVPGVVREWEPDMPTRCVTGAAASHLTALALHRESGSQQPALVLEDDARLIGGAAVDVPILPEDCAYYLMGSESGSCLYAGPGLHEVLPPFFGVHAIVYNTPALDRVRFFEQLAVTLMTAPIGEGPGRIGLEHLLVLMAARARLKIYRGDTMPFTTHASHSERLGRMMAPRWTPQPNGAVPDYQQPSSGQASQASQASQES